jgi:hypothetical protein
MNRTYNRTMHGTPDNVAKQPEQEFLVLQDNAEKMKHNDAVERRRVEKLVTEDGPGKFRPPLLPRQHNFENRVGVRRFGPTRQVAGIGSGWVRDTRGKEFPIKLVLPVRP